MKRRRKLSDFPEPTLREGAGSVIACFEDIGFELHLRPAHGRNDLIYSFKPIDLRHERRSFSPERRREMQKLALQTYLGDEASNYTYKTAADGDVVARRK